MFRTVTLFMPLLLIAAAVAADDAVESATAPQREAVKQEQPKAESDVKKEEPKAGADAQKEGAKPEGDVKMSGMSILGNDEAPKSLVIVPWKNSQLGEKPGLSKLLDDSTQPVDKDVFMRELAYYQIRSNSK
jgi:hypothetical protein